MVQRRRFSSEYKREAVAMLDIPSVSQIATELGTGANVLGKLAAGGIARMHRRIWGWKG
jgi:transposase-like protein